MVVAAVALLVWPAALTAGALDLAPFAWLLIFLAAILLPPPSPVVEGTLIWLAVTFVGYNFLLADPRTHIYGIFLPWSLLAGAALAGIWNACKPARLRWAGIALAGGVAACFCPFLSDSYLRHDTGLNQDRPADPAGVGMGAGTVHQATDYRYFRQSAPRGLEGNRRAADAEGKLTGDFDGNEKPEVTVWYVPSAYRLSRADSDRCGSKPR